MDFSETGRVDGDEIVLEGNTGKPVRLIWVLVNDFLEDSRILKIFRHIFKSIFSRIILACFNFSVHGIFNKGLKVRIKFFKSLK